MSISEWYIRRPIATSLLMLGLLVLGSTAYTLLPVAALPDADFPTISVSANLPGASPETMATSVATPLELQFSAIPGLVALTSWSGLGNTSITLQFTLGRSIDGAATDVQTAINAAGGLLPKDLPNPPTYRKVNPSDRAVLIYAVYSDDLPMYKVDDFAYTVLAQQIQSVSGVGQVIIAGQQDFAVRIRANPAALAAHGIGLEEVRAAIATATTNQAKGTLESRFQSLTLDANDQLFGAAGYRDIIVAFRNGAPVKIRDIADVVDGARMPRTGAWYNGKKAEVLLIFRQPGANTTRIVDQVRAMMPQLLTSLPKSMHVDLISDRSLAIDAAIADVKFTLILTIALVVMVIFLFLRHFWATVIPSIAVPLALIFTFAVMYPLGYSVNGLTLMALTIAVGFVVDDAIVMIENIVRYREKGDTPVEAALKGSGEIGFTIVSMTFSLVAVFIPLLLMGGMVGVLFREFAVTVTAAVVMSAFVSLTLTPVMCAHFLRPAGPAKKRGRLDQMCEDAFDAMLRVYDRGLRWVLAHQPLALASTIALAILTGWLYVTIPKGLFPEQDTGFIFGQAEAREDISFARMVERQNELAAIVLADPAVSAVIGFAGTSGFNPSENVARIYHSAEAVLGTRRLGPAGHPASAAQGGKGAGPQGLPPGGAGSQFRRPAEPHRVPVHADLERPGLARSLGADPREAPARHSRDPGRRLRPADHRPPSRHRGRPRHGLAARRFAVGDRPDPLRRFRRAPGGDDLQLGHPVQGPARGGDGFRPGPGGAVAPLCLGRQRHAGAAQHRRQLRQQGLAAHHQPSGRLPRGDAVLQPRAGRGAQRGGRADRQDPPRAQRTAHRAGRLPGHGADLPELARHDAVPDRRGDPGRLHRAGHALRNATSIPSRSCRPCRRPASAPCWR